MREPSKTSSMTQLRSDLFDNQKDFDLVNDPCFKRLHLGTFVMQQTLTNTKIGTKGRVLPLQNLKHVELIMETEDRKLVIKD